MVRISTINGKISPFVLSVYGMIGKESLFVLTNFSQLVASKMEEPILHVQRWINGWITIVVEILYSRMINGSFLPSSLWDKDTDWE